MAPDGFRYFPGYLDAAAQQTLCAEVLAGLAAAPVYTPTMPRTGAPFSVQMSNFGALGWLSDRDGGYRYAARHPVTGAPWPAMPEMVVGLWAALADYPDAPEACLVNLYRAGARMGLHVDADEDAKDAPVLSISLGDSAVFRLGGPARRDPARRMTLRSGDVLVMGGASRRAFHGVDKILAGSSRLIPGGGRINLTLRRVTLAPRPAMEPAYPGDRR